jgi:hypothetical protein
LISALLSAFRLGIGVSALGAGAGRDEGGGFASVRPSATKIRLIRNSIPADPMPRRNLKTNAKAVSSLFVSLDR